MLGSHKVRLCPLCWSVVRPTSTMGTIELRDFTALFVVFLETNKHQNLMRLRWPMLGDAGGVACSQVVSAFILPSSGTGCLLHSVDIHQSTYILYILLLYYIALRLPFCYHNRFKTTKIQPRLPHKLPKQR